MAGYSCLSVSRSMVMYIRQASAKSIPARGQNIPRGETAGTGLTHFFLSFFRSSYSLLPPASVSSIHPDPDVMQYGKMGAVAQSRLQDENPARYFPHPWVTHSGSRVWWLCRDKYLIWVCCSCSGAILQPDVRRAWRPAGEWNEKRRRSPIWQAALRLNDYTEAPCWHVIFKVSFFPGPGLCFSSLILLDFGLFSLFCFSCSGISWSDTAVGWGLAERPIWVLWHMPSVPPLCLALCSIPWTHVAVRGCCPSCLLMVHSKTKERFGPCSSRLSWRLVALHSARVWSMQIKERSLCQSKII